MAQLFAQQARVQVATNVVGTTETTLVGAGVGTITLPASFFQTGLTIRLEASGLFVQQLSTACTCNLRVKKGSTVLAASGAVVIPTGYVGVRWWVDFQIEGRSTTSVYCTATWCVCGPNGNDGYFYQMPAYTGSLPTGLTTISTSSEALSLTAQFGASPGGLNTESITCDSLVVSF